MKRIFIKIFILIFVVSLFTLNSVNAEELSERLKGRILLQVEDVGQAWYVDPVTKQRAFLGRPADAFRIMKELGLGVSEKDFNSFGDTAPSRLSGKILLRVEANGEAYYVYPIDLKMYYLGRPTDAFEIMREKGLGITNEDLNKVSVFEKYKEEVKSPEPAPEPVLTEPEPTPEPSPPEQLPTIEFKVNNSSESEIFILVGDEITFAWNSENAESCKFTDENGDEYSLFAEEDKLSGSKTILGSTFEDKVYNYTCENNVGTETKTITVKIEPYITAGADSVTTNYFKNNTFYDNFGEFYLTNYLQDKVKINKLKIKFQDFFNNNDAELTVYLHDNETAKELEKTCIVTNDICEVEFDVSNENFEVLGRSEVEAKDQRNFSLKVKITGFAWHSTIYTIVSYYLTDIEFADSTGWPENAITAEDYTIFSESNPVYLGSFEKN
jgi:hypothetical protein